MCEAMQRSLNYFSVPQNANRELKEVIFEHFLESSVNAAHVKHILVIAC